MKKLIIVFGLMVFSLQGQSQALEVGVFGGGTYYLGDLNPKLHFLQTQLAYGGIVRYVFDSRWAVRAGYYMGRLVGDDAISNYFPERDLRFVNNLKEVSVIAEFNFLDYFNGSRRNYISPFIYGGLGGFLNNPLLLDGELRIANTEGQGTDYIYAPRDYGKIQLAVPFGIGLKYSFSKKVCATVEWGLRKTFTDYVDDVSNDYYLSSSAQLDDLTPNDDFPVSDPTMNHEPGMQRGYSQFDDWYSYFGATLTFQVTGNKKGKCSEFQKP